MKMPQYKTPNSCGLGRPFSKVKDDFPILKREHDGKPLIFLDSAASAQKPVAVVNAMTEFYFNDYANIHRGIYELSQRATDLYESVREKIRQFINAKSIDEIVFVRGTTEGINLIAHLLGNTHIKEGDEVILTEMEHHSNIVPWYLLKERGVKLSVVPILDNGAIDKEAYIKAFTAKTKLVAISHVSNALGTINPIKELTSIAHALKVPVLVDGAQAIPHMQVDVSDLDCDFYVFSAHKLYGPTGIGVLYAKGDWFKTLPPYQGGGDMIETVAFDKITFAKPPQKFEAGTPDIAGVIGLGAAIDYVNQFGMDSIFQHEQSLLDYAEPKLLAIDDLKIIGTAKPKVGVISFLLGDIHPHDVGTVLDHEGIAVRAGHHCAMPLMERLKVPATVRASFGIYTDEKDIDALVHGIVLAKRLFS